MLEVDLKHMVIDIAVRTKKPMQIDFVTVSALNKKELELSEN